MSSVPQPCVTQVQSQNEGQVTKVSEDEGHMVTMTILEHQQLLDRLRIAEERARVGEENLQRAFEDLQNIR